MTNSQRLASIRIAIRRWLLENGTGAEAEVDSEIGRESILIRGEFYCGHRLSTSTHRAVWFIEEDELKIFQQDGVLCVRLSGQEIDALVDQDDEASMEEVAEEVSTLPHPSTLPDATQREPVLQETSAEETRDILPMRLFDESSTDGNPSADESISAMDDNEEHQENRRAA